MATTNKAQTQHDALLSLRHAIATNTLPTATTSADNQTATTTATDDLAKATHLYFQNPTPHTISLTTPTRFVSASTDSAVDLRSIFFAWQKKDVAIPEYITSAQELNEALSKVQEGEKQQEEQEKSQSGGDNKTATTTKVEKKTPVQNLVFVERLDLITWLEGASDESEYIRPLEGEGGVVKGQAIVDGGVGGGVGVGDDSGARKDVSGGLGPEGRGGGIPSAGVGAGAGAVQHGRGGKVIDPRLQEIYNLERKMGDRNSVLRGIKPTDFSHVRKTAEIFLGRNRSRPGQYPPGTKPSSKHPLPSSSTTGANISSSSSLGSSLPTRKSKHSSRSGDPIILLSPSASSLIRTSNAKTFLQDGIFVPPDHPTLASSDPSNILKIEHPLRINISNNPAAAAAAAAASSSSSTPGSVVGSHSVPKQDTRFVLVDTTANFRPEYWNRVVAVFTTGQTWQFKSYKWSSPPELFKHATGIFVGFRGDDVPREVKGWGRGVNSFAVERWDEKGGVQGAGRWRDREVVEGIWTAIEEGMRLRGWGAK